LREDIGAGDMGIFVASRKAFLNVCDCIMFDRFDVTLAVIAATARARWRAIAGNRSFEGNTGFNEVLQTSARCVQEMGTFNDADYWC
jgi:hypothetical protein